MELDKIRSAIKAALAGEVQAMRFPGIVDAELRKVFLTEKLLQQTCARLEEQNFAETDVSAEIVVFLRVSNSDVMQVVDHDQFSLQIGLGSNGDVHALVSSVKDWVTVWERGIETIKYGALEGIRRDIHRLDSTLTEDNPAFRSAVVLLASELVGPYPDRLAAFTGYSKAFVQVVAARLQQAKIWDGDDVDCQSWFDETKGAAALLLDLLVAEGQLTRKWSDERNQYVYFAVEELDAGTTPALAI